METIDIPTLTFLPVGSLPQEAAVVFNVKTQYRAVGDGATDDTTAVANAVAAATAAGGGIVFFPAGTYKMSGTSQLQPGAKVILAGAGQSSILLISGGSSGYIQLSSDQSGIRDLTIKRGSSTPSRLVHVTAANCEIRSVFFDGAGASFAGRGVSAASGAVQLLIAGCVFSAINGEGISLNGCDGARIVFNRWAGHLGASSAINANSNNGRLVITDNVFVMDSSATGDCVAIATSAVADAETDFIVSNNYMETVRFGLEFVQTSVGSTPVKLIASGNIMKCIAGSFGGISVSRATNAVISGNLIDGNGRASLPTAIEVAGSSYVSVTGNTIMNNGSGTFVAGIILNNSSHCTVTGNVINGFKDASQSAGIILTAPAGTSAATSDNVVSGNMIHFPTAAAGTNEFGIFLQCSTVTGHIDRNVIVANQIYGNNVTGSKGVYLNVATAGTIDRNLVGMNVIQNCATPISQVSDTNTLLSGTTWNLTT